MLSVSGLSRSPRPAASMTAFMLHPQSAHEGFPAFKGDSEGLPRSLRYPALILIASMRGPGTNSAHDLLLQLCFRRSNCGTSVPAGRRKPFPVHDAGNRRLAAR